METALKAICAEEGRPTIHARNLFHLSIAMYDAWAVYQEKKKTYLLGKELHGFSSNFDIQSFKESSNPDSAANICINHAAYRFLFERFNMYSSKGRTLDIIDSTAAKLNIDIDRRSLDFEDGSPESLGNYIAKNIIDYGLQDGSKEEDLYEANFYSSVNPPLKPHLPGNPTIKYPNRWQPLNVLSYVDKKGMEPDLLSHNFLTIAAQGDFLSPEWGEVAPFSLDVQDLTIKKRDELPYKLYCDPGSPPLLNFENDSLAAEAYKWGFLLVAIWSAQLDPTDSVKWNISPGVFGNEMELPRSYEEFRTYYQLTKGGTRRRGYLRNPVTNKPYADNWVLRGDYARVIAEFWVDGINTETPPGHWFKTLNFISDHPLFERKWRGKGKELDPLAWDIKAYFSLAGAMHDVAIAAWGAKAYYDYIRPISAIRMMADYGQCTNPKLPNYHINGLPLIKGKIELVQVDDDLAGKQNEHVNKLKIFAWRGPEYINNPQDDVAGVGWILAENWWPYQRYSQATPPFAGYVSGHSAFSSAAAVILEEITGNPFFPGGIAEFRAKTKEFLLFEDGPSNDVLLQWATYRDAANETCLSRIWGGIHPPADDVAGRFMGQEIGLKAFGKAIDIFKGKSIQYGKR